MGIGNMVLNGRKNCSREAAIPVSEEPAFWEALTVPTGAWPQALLVLGVHEERAISLEGWRSHKPTAAAWLGTGDLLGTLYAYSQAASAVTLLYGVPRKIHCDGRDNPPASELSWETAGLPFLAASLESCLHKAAAAGGSSTPAPQHPASSRAARVAPCQQKTLRRPKQI